MIVSALLAIGDGLMMMRDDVDHEVGAENHVR